MTHVPLPDEAREALADGKTVELKHPDLNLLGHNETIRLGPEDPLVGSPVVNIVDE